jgi:hypothetical protein
MQYPKSLVALNDPGRSRILRSCARSVASAGGHRNSHDCCIGKLAFQDNAKASDRCRSLGRALVTLIDLTLVHATN